MSKIATVKENVKMLIQAEPQCARSYTLLVIRYWMKIEGATDFASALGCTSPEAITRAFRELVRAGEITLPEDVAMRRQEMEDEYRRVYGGKPLPGFIDLTGTDI